jgi:MoxR-like ATPase
MAAGNQTLQLINKTIRHMGHMNAGHQVGGILLAGDPGIGKTTFVGLLGYLLGLKTIVIEVPHITEEHLINIPFIVFNPQTGGTQRMQAQLPTEKDEKGQDYRVVLAQSSLFTQMTAATPMSDQQYMEHIKKAPKHIQNIFIALGGNETTIPPVIAKVRQQHTSILFLDEFYRQTSMRIRNILRGILNGNIGLHKIPKSVYIIYASNMRDQGLDQIPSNHQFTVVEQKAPGKDDWFDWLVSNYENHSDVNLNGVVLQKFKKALKDEDISFTDAPSEVRTSPRRWEQVILYVNAAIPPKNAEDAKSLITNVKNSFLHYKTGQASSLSKKVVAAVKELIKETSGQEFREGEDTNDATEWRKTLQHYVEQQMRTGGARKHIPVVAGPPGIGKTTMAAAVAAEHDLRLIDIDLGEIYADDAVGLPIPGDRSGDNITVRFSMPKLYHQIMQKIEAADKAYFAQLKQENGANAEKFIKQYENRRWKYLIFFDEMNRVDEKTFNALRKVVLEKNFGTSGEQNGELLKLPKESIVVAAINPEGGGTSDLTDHFRDVVDVIPAQGNWESTRKWLQNKRFADVAEPVPSLAMSIVDTFIKKFKSKDSKHPVSQQPFYLDSNGMEVYISPREYADMYATLIREIDAAYDQALKSKTVEKMRDQLDDVIGEALEDSLNMAFYKNDSGIDREDFMHTMRIWVTKLPHEMFKDLLSRKATGEASSSNALTPYMNGKSIVTMPDDAGIINSNNLANNSQVIEEIREMMRGLLTNEEAVKKYITTPTQPKVTLVGDKLKTDPKEKVSALENVFLGLLYTLHIHQFVNDRLSVIGKAMNQSISEVRKELVSKGALSEEVSDELISTTAEIRSAIVDMISELS